MKTFLLHSLLLLGLSMNQPTFASEDHDHEKQQNQVKVHDDNHHESSHNSNDKHEEDKHSHEEEHHDEDEHEHNETDQSHEHEEEMTSHIDDVIAKQVGIHTTHASTQQLHQTITSYGSLTTGPEQLSHVHARYNGLVTTVKATIGDRVKAGQLLAVVESNDSLKKYHIVSPISGTVIQRHANTGEVTQDQVLFSIANFKTLWAEFRIYPAQQAQVTEGQNVHIVVNDKLVISKIQHIIPALNKPYQLARVKINNQSLGLSPGLLIEGYITTGTFKVKLAVNIDAIQTLEGKEGVFIKRDNEYSFTPLVLGRSDDHYVEVLQGLESGQEYVDKNSYLIKADIEKSEAEHVH